MFSIRRILANTGVYASLLATGDIVCQKLELRTARQKAQLANLPTDTKELSWDRQRTSVFLIGGIPLGTICHFWYSFIDRSLPGKAIKIVLAKTAADQLLFTPAFYASFFTILGSVEGKTLAECWQEIKQKALIVYASDLVFWPPIQLANFYFISPRFRVVYVSCATVCWNVFLSFAKTSKLSFAKVKGYFIDKKSWEDAA